MYFERMREYYEAQSSNRYSINGAVHGWVKVPFNEARYGRNSCGSNVCTNVYYLIRDVMSYWVAQELASGKTIAQVRDYLATFDKWDRNDADGDGNFNEPDSFVDHFQIVHSGGDEAAGDPQQGEDAIWSHRSLAGFAVGPQGNIGFDAGSNSTSTASTATGYGAVHASEPSDRHLGRRLHDPARERRPRRLRARVRA